MHRHRRINKHGPTHTIDLCARTHRYRLRYEPGQEADVLKVVREIADDPNEALDWFDAALVAYELARRLTDHERARPRVRTSLTTEPPETGARPAPRRSRNTFTSEP